MNTRGRRLLLLALGIVLVWYASVLVWSSRTEEDAVPLGNTPGWETIPSTAVAPTPINNNEIVVQRVECGSVFDGQALAESVPQIPFPRQYNREPCVLQHHDSRLIFVIDTVVVLGVIGGVATVMVRHRRRPHHDVPPGQDRLVGSSV